jgi:phenylacetate-coenzyme A ligase PaaK-like adenylate-forming protein
VSATPITPVLDGFSPQREIRRSVRGQERHRSRLRAAARDLMRFGRMGDADRLTSALEARLGSLRAALWRSPFYLATLHRLALSPNDLQRLSDLRFFPLLDRDALGAGFADLPAFGSARHGRLLVDRSSGTTGRPVSLVKDDYDTVHPWAVLRFWLRWHGRALPRLPRVALLCSLPHGVEYETRLPAFHDGTLVRISLARPEPAARLRAFRPHVLFTDPAGLFWLVSNGERLRPRLVLSSALHLAPDLRRRAEAALGAPVVNYYSTTETGPIAWECALSEDRFHVLHPDVWVEPVAGELVVTRLRESVVPLLRYRTGDAGDVVGGACQCGYRGRTIVGFRGRRACLFRTPSGDTVDAWRLAWVFRHHPLDGFRLTQEKPDAFRLETAGEADRELVSRLAASLRSLGWSDPAIDVGPLARSASGAKPQPFVAQA